MQIYLSTLKVVLFSIGKNLTTVLINSFISSLFDNFNLSFVWNYHRAWDLILFSKSHLNAKQWLAIVFLFSIWLLTDNLLVPVEDSDYLTFGFTRDRSITSCANTDGYTVAITYKMYLWLNNLPRVEVGGVEKLVLGVKFPNTNLIIYSQKASESTVTQVASLVVNILF